MKIASSDQDEPLLFTPETLERLWREVEELRTSHLRRVDDAGADPFAEREYLMALAALEQAKNHFAMAQLFQIRALAR